MTPAYQAMDFLLLPSYREGFPNVVLEASSAGRPTVGFRSTGVRDAIFDGETGQLGYPGDALAAHPDTAHLLERLGPAS